MENLLKTNLSRTLDGEAIFPPPVWLMRQAGRYLPEYRELRSRTGSFWKMCMTPDLAAEVTMQPIRRFGFDAAIVFSDILVVPFALGKDIVFEESGGPSLEPVRSVDELETDSECWAKKLEPVYQTLRAVAGLLDQGKALLGFAGAPWTLATYMAEGGGSPDQKAARLWGYRDSVAFRRLLSILESCIAAHLIAQLHAGTTAVQIFDSWAGGLTPRQFREWVVEPTQRVVAHVRAQIPDAKIIGFPRGAALNGYERYAAETGVSAVSIDTAVPIDWAIGTLAPGVAVQGNLDPLALIAGGRVLDDAVDEILAAAKGGRFIFNLGHGVLPETPVEHVAQLVHRIRQAC